MEMSIQAPSINQVIFNINQNNFQDRPKSFKIKSFSSSLKSFKDTRTTQKKFLFDKLKCKSSLNSKKKGSNVKNVGFFVCILISFYICCDFFSSVVWYLFPPKSDEMKWRVNTFLCFCWWDIFSFLELCALGVRCVFLVR